MKKTLTAAITSALAIGVASVTFAAANPFSDVPTNHWSFDAVAKLAQEGVIEGYGDNTFRGDAHITRYEMAQMVAKAMAREDVSAADKATIDKLAAEYADELNNLGVRVANLEKKSDNVQFSGLMRLNNARTWTEGANHKDKNDAVLRLNLKAQVNEDWNVRGRLEGTSELKNNGAGEVKVQRVYAEGPLLGAKAEVGRYSDFDMPGFTAGGMLIDSASDGLKLKYDGKVSTILNFGRIGGNGGLATGGDLKANYAGAQFAYQASDSFKVGAGYFQLSNIKDGVFKNLEDKNGIWEVAMDYSFDKNVTLGAIYAASSIDGEKVGADSDHEKSYNVKLTYKGVDAKVPGSFGIWAGYRQQGALVDFAPTYETSIMDSKGYEVGFDYMLDKNILAKVVYYDAESLGDTGIDKSMLYSRVQFSF